MSESSSDRGKTVYMAVFAAMITSAATTYGLRALENPPSDEPPAEDTIPVPALLGLEQETAAELARARGLRVVVRAQEPSADYPEGRVASQEPLAGSEVPANTAVNIVISSGQPMIDVPDVSGKTLEEARIQIGGAGLEVAGIDETGSGPPGTVSSTDPAAGTSVAAGSAVRIVASPAGIVVPDFVGTNYRRAREAITSAGLKVGQVRRRYDEGIPEMAVRAQDPSAGTVVPAETEVSLTIND